MTPDDLIFKQINDIYKLIHNLYINKLNDDDNNDNLNIDNIIDFIQTKIYNVNHLQSQLNETLESLKKVKQDNCLHHFIYDNINYEPMRIVCNKCNKIN